MFPSLVINGLAVALIACSLFNTITMVWLAGTVLLNTNRRSWGTWIAGGGLLLGALFFAIHSTIVGQSVWRIGREMALWWRIGWAPFIAAPYLWFLAMLWYTRLSKQPFYRLAAVIGALLGLGALLMLAVDSPLPSYDEIIQREPIVMASVAGIPVVALAYPAYSIGCIFLALVALLRPAASQRFMGDLARTRARPWLIAASLSLLGITLAAGIAVSWLLERVRDGEAPLLSTRSLAAIVGFDLLLSALVALVVVLLGNAVVAYEIFTSKALPRGGLARYWRQFLWLAVGYALVVGLCSKLPIAPAYVLAFVTVLVAAIHAVLTRQSFTEREHSVVRLRSFVGGESMVSDTPPAPGAANQVPFITLCDDVLNVELAFLVPLGANATLAGAPLSFPANTPPPPAESLAFLVARCTDPTQLCVPVESQDFAGAGWAVPLWGVRGLAGLLLIGEKRDGRLFTQEEIEVARAAGEHLIDTQASAELARRLAALQRQRMAESQILDRRTRRVLHDDVLPSIHAAILRSAEAPPSPTTTDLQNQLVALHSQVAGLLRDLPPVIEPALAQHGLINALERTIGIDLPDSFDQIDWRVSENGHTALAELPPLSQEVLFYAAREVVRNAARHGRGNTPERQLTLRVAVEALSGWVRLVISDDGVGTQRPPMPGGSGRGMDLHATLLAVLGGTIATNPALGGGTQVVIDLPRE